MELDRDEARRVAALYMLGVLDTGFEERFDRLTRIAAAIFGTPISLISLVDTDRQWFKSSFGLPTRQTPRDIAFCAHAICDTEVFVVPDARNDTRFAKNPLVTGSPQIRFYAGAPLITTEGNALGTLCIIDDKPREGFKPADQQVLKDLAATVMDFFEMQLAIKKSEVRDRLKRN